uniref:Uncharacterized protein n=1 Tax=Anguilla anguilla TaxID=7936 RepID=A0A0E9Y0F7_ANGAN
MYDGTAKPTIGTLKLGVRISLGITKLNAGNSAVKGATSMFNRGTVYPGIVKLLCNELEVSILNFSYCSLAWMYEEVTRATAMSLPSTKFWFIIFALTSMAL